MRWLGGMPLRVPKHYPAVTRGFSRNIVEGVPPKRHRAFKLAAMHDNGTDAHAHQVSSPPNRDNRGCRLALR
jgi:hypothetical protein